MIIAILIVVGLCLGSFVNALVWRLREQETESAKKKPDRSYLQKLSVGKGRSMCPHCRHELNTRDLLPVVSWVSLKGKCRYCGKPISWQYPVVELATAALFVWSYLAWPKALNGAEVAIFVLWLGLLVGFMALTVYDLRWFLLPNRIIWPLGLVAAAIALIRIAAAPRPLAALVNAVAAVAVGGGIFYGLYQFSGGKWIGGGDVKLGWLLGLAVGAPALALLFIFLASVLGTVVSVPLLLKHRLRRTSSIPFGPFLIAGAIIAQLYGPAILQWYNHTFLLFP